MDKVKTITETTIIKTSTNLNRKDASITSVFLKSRIGPKTRKPKIASGWKVFAKDTATNASASEHNDRI